MPSPYDEAAYRRARAELKANPAPCWVCGRPGTTVDHVPSLSQHRHVKGSGCCTLRPACARCNYGGRATRTRMTARDRPRDETEALAALAGGRRPGECPTRRGAYHSDDLAVICPHCRHA